MQRRRRLQAAAVVDDDDDDGEMAYALSRHRARLASAIDLPETLSEYIEEVLQWYYRKFPIVAVEPAAAAPELSMGWVGLGLPQQVLKI